MKIIRFTKVVTATTINTPPFAVQSWVAAFYKKKMIGWKNINTF